MLTWKIVMFFSKFGPFELAVLWHFCENFLNMNFFGDIISSETSYSFRLQSLSSFLSVGFPLWSSSGCIPRVSQRQIMLTFTRSTLFSISPFMFFSGFTSSVTSYDFLCYDSFFVSQFLFSITPFCKIECGFIIVRQEVNTTTCFAVCAWDE